jgi:hypothetical protein
MRRNPSVSDGTLYSIAREITVQDEKAINI